MFIDVSEPAVRELDFVPFSRYNCDNDFTNITICAKFHHDGNSFSWGPNFLNIIRNIFTDRKLAYIEVLAWFKEVNKATKVLLT